MPVIVTNYTWTQTLSEVNIKVPLNGVPTSYVDLFTSDSYIKAHYQPFLFEVFLLHDIASSKSECYLHDGTISFRLVKTNNTEWEQLEKDLTKQQKLQMKKDVIAKSQELAKINFEEKVTRNNELNRFAVRQAMDIDSRNHKIIDDRRNAERNKAMDELEKWRLNKETVNQFAHKSSGATITELKYEPPPLENLKLSHTKKAPGASLQSTNSEKKLVRSEYVDKKKEEAKNRVLPPVRGTSELVVNFSARVFPTPSRESQAEEEQIWLKNMTAARRATGFVSEDLRPEEQDPQWCKEKGDEFFSAGNLLGAISAYTHGIKLSPTLPALHANRAAAHFALGNFNKCTTDCSTALELMKPPCEGNRVSRARCLARRGAALARLGLLSKAIGEMKAAAKLLPTDEKLKQDIYDMERAWEQNPDSD